MSRQQRPLGELLTASFPQVKAEVITAFCNYYELVLKWNKHISLTTLTEPRDFLERHLGEAIFAAELISVEVSEFWDIGSGLGVPGIPVAILRPDLDVRLVESNRKKAIFLEEAIEALKLARTRVINSRFENLTDFAAKSCVSMRAIEKMSDIIDMVLEKGRAAHQFLIFGGPDLRFSSVGDKKVTHHLIPRSTERFLYEIS